MASDTTSGRQASAPASGGQVLRREAQRLAAGGLVLGVVVFAAPRRAARLLGLPATHVNGSALLMARLYAIREAARGVQLIGEARSESGPSHATALLNAGIDTGDAVMFAVLAVREPELRRASTALGLFAGGVSAFWMRYARHVRVANDAGHAGPAHAGWRDRTG